MSFVANTQSRALRVKCPMDGELSSERKKAVRLLRCRTRIPLFHDEDERKFLFIIHTANLFSCRLYLRCDNRGVFVPNTKIPSNFH